MSDRLDELTNDGAQSATRFAHPVESALAGVFDRFGIEWRYEPRTFVLERRQGQVVEACTPDFYLPDLDMYVECTCMDQRLVSRKNRKYRKLRERFGVVVEIMYRRDLVRLGRSHGLTELLRAASPCSEPDLR
jgi:hypoxanthine phosphoribosyltransferase